MRTFNRMTVNVTSVAEAEAYAKNDLSAKLAIPADDIKVLESGEKTWPDASLGMPEPGQVYAQVLIEGFRIVLEASGKKYEYHLGNGIVKMRPAKR
jgi:hypothetical protein